jgi:hypothetical protein
VRTRKEERAARAGDDRRRARVSLLCQVDIGVDDIAGVGGVLVGEEGGVDDV